MPTNRSDDDAVCGSMNTLPMPDAYIDEWGRYIDEWGHPVDDIEPIPVGDISPDDVISPRSPYPPGRVGDTAEGEEAERRDAQPADYRP